MRDADVLAYTILWIAIMVGACALAYADYQECRRVHPAWYCFAH